MSVPIKAVSIEKIAHSVGVQAPLLNPNISSIAPIQTAGEGALSFCVPKYHKHLKEARCSALLVPKVLKETVPSGVAVIETEHPLALMNKILRIFTAEGQKTHRPCIAPNAIIHPSTHVPASCSVGPNAVIGARCVLGENVVIECGVVIGDDVRIGEGSHIEPHAFIADRTRMGQFCVVGASSVVGRDGFGYVKTDQGIEKIIHAGAVVMKDRVELGAHASICRGVLGDTLIGEGSKLDAHVHLAHNVQVGARAYFAAGAGVAGSTIIGDNFQMGGHSGVNGHIEICDNVSITGGSNVHKSIEHAGTYMGFIPAKPIREWVKVMGQFEKEQA